MNNENGFKIDPRLNYLISTLQDSIDNRLAWIQRKEIAIWSATVLYLAGLIYLFRFLYNNNSSLIDELNLPSCIFFSIIIIVLYIFGISIFAFIHANFGSIYFTRALFQEATKLKTEVLLDELPEFSELLEEKLLKDVNREKERGNYEDFVYPSFIYNRIHKRKTHTQQFQKSGYFRIIILIFSLIILNWGPIKWWKKCSLNNGVVIREASIYSLIFFPNLIFTIWLFSSLFCST